MDKSKTEDLSNNDFNYAIKWWERKRIWYNFIALIGGLIGLIGKGDVPNGISPHDESYLILFWLFGANIFYSGGWGIEALSVYHFKTKYFGNEFRLALFILGSLLSFVWMFLLSRPI